MRIKEECLKVFKVADANLSLKRLLALKGQKLCANVKNVEESSPLIPIIVLQQSVSEENDLLCSSVDHMHLRNFSSARVGSLC